MTSETILKLDDDPISDICDNNATDLPIKEAVSDQTPMAETDTNYEKNELLAQIDELRTRLESAERTAREISAGWRELSELYPDADISSLPNSFTNAVERGIPPAAAYALEMRRREVERAKIEEAAERSRKMSAGKIKSADDKLYSPEEVRAMSPSEVKNNIEKIRRSMKSWR